VDSSLIVAMMQRHSVRRVQTFTIGFGEPAYDESREAQAVASHLGTEHHTLQLAPGDALDVVPRLSHIYDEPFADSSQIPTHLVCRAARSRVTVALSGDGGDELFGGYNRYLWAPRVWRQLAWLPHPARQFLGASLGSLASVSERSGMARQVRRPSEKMRKLGAAIRGTRSVDDLYRNLVASWHQPEDILLASTAAKDGPRWLPPAPARGVDDAPERMMYWDAMTYLGDDILCKVDRAAMATSLETRAPFLDSQVAEVAWRLPIHMRVRNGETKWALRQILHQYVPRELIERPKTGFSVPLGAWLKGPLRDWAEDLLNEQTLRDQGLLKPGPIRSLWSQHLRGFGDYSQRLWCILMFQAWLAAIAR
jgi:asparagine synthase (glutamine-hydrolysing)